VNRVSEFYETEHSRQGNLDRQTLEMDADCTALTRCCNLAILIVTEPSRVHPDFQQFYKDIYSAFFDIHFAICNTLMLFGDRDFRNNLPGKGTHPDPRVRQLMISMTFQEIATTRNLTIDLKKLENVLVDGVVDSLGAYQHVTGKKINKEIFMNEYYGNNPLLTAVLNNWKERIREQLMPYTYKPLSE